MFIGKNKIKEYFLGIKFFLEVCFILTLTLQSAFLQTLQKHYHPDVSKAAMLINTPLSDQEDDINKVLEITAYEVMWHGVLVVKLHVVY